MVHSASKAAGWIAPSHSQPASPATARIHPTTNQQLQPHPWEPNRQASVHQAGAAEIGSGQIGVRRLVPLEDNLRAS